MNMLYFLIGYTTCVVTFIVIGTILFGKKILISKSVIDSCPHCGTTPEKQNGGSYQCSFCGWEASEII